MEHRRKIDLHVINFHIKIYVPINWVRVRQFFFSNDLNFQLTMYSTVGVDWLGIFLTVVLWPQIFVGFLKGTIFLNLSSYFFNIDNIVSLISKKKKNVFNNTKNLFIGKIALLLFNGHIEIILFIFCFMARAKELFIFNKYSFHSENT